ncbi:hypothetical protein CIB84_008569, partial [Bambusicola thoracicus]
KVYVKLDHSSPHILCVTNRLRNSELIDPVFRWNGPSGYLSSEEKTMETSDFHLTGLNLFLKTASLISQVVVPDLDD